MFFFALTLAEIGLNPITIFLILIFGGFFLFSFAVTSPNMDTKGLLRVLYAKPTRKADGTVEYKKED